MTPRERCLRALAGESVSPIPFTMYAEMAPQTSGERALRNRGMCLLKRRSAIKVHRPNVKTYSRPVDTSDGRQMEVVHETPHGTLSMRHAPAGFTNWQTEYLFKSADDYKALAFLYADEVFEPDYQAFAEAERRAGGDTLFRAYLGREPLQELIAGPGMGTATFCMEWMENRDDMLKLYDVLVENRRRQYEVVAASPATHINYGGNVTPQIIGPKVFKDYYLPHYHEAAQVIGKHGKLLGCHFDADCGPIADLIAEADLDYIEAFTPAPDTDMTLAQARAKWKDKVLWLNFPSSLHLAAPAVVEQTTVDLLNQIDNVTGLIMGITEDIPSDRWEASCMAVMQGLDRHAQMNPSAYDQPCAALTS